MFLATNSYVIGPLIAFAAVAVLAAILRWAYDAGSKSKRARLEQILTARHDPTAPADYGLLATAVVAKDMREARELRRRLERAGIRATFSPANAGCVNVMVFENQLAEARRVAGGYTTS